MKSKGEKVNWDEQAYFEDNRRCEIGSGFPCLTDELFTDGARWQRDQLRTNEAIERLALFLLEDEGYDTSSGWPSNEQLGGGPAGDRDTELKDAYMGHARAAITALLGGSDSD